MRRAQHEDLLAVIAHDGRRDPTADCDLAARLQKAGHMSPFEHAAKPMNPREGEGIYPRETFLGNFRGWVQYRKMLPGEAVFGAEAT
jgi:hypothetical protein